MATVGKFDGELLVLKVDDDPVSLGGAGNSLAVGCYTSKELTISREESERPVCAADALSGASNFKETAYGQGSWQVTFDGVIQYDSVVNVDEFSAIILGEVVVEITWGTGVTGDPLFTGLAIMTEFGQTANVNETAVYSATFIGTGPIVKTTSA